MSLLGERGQSSVATTGTAHLPQRWQNELRDCIINAIRPGSLCTSTTDLSARYNKRYFPLWPGFQSMLSPKEATTDACMERLTSGFCVYLPFTDFPNTDPRSRANGDHILVLFGVTVMWMTLMTVWMMLTFNNDEDAVNDVSGAKYWALNGYWALRLP